MILGEGCTGKIMYTHDGYMSVLKQHKWVPGYKGYWLEGTPEERANAAGKTLTYSGTFSLSDRAGDEGVVIHYLQDSLPPNWRHGS